MLKYLGIPTEPDTPVEPDNEVLIPRKCEVCLIDALTGDGYTANVLLPSLASPKASPKSGRATLGDAPAKLPSGTHPAISMEELAEAELIVREDEIVQQICADIGIKKEQIWCDGWSVGFDDRFDNARRLQQCFMYARFSEHDVRQLFSAPTTPC